VEKLNKVMSVMFVAEATMLDGVFKLQGLS